MDAVDDDDPVVHEVDVYLSKQLAEQLYVLQFPVRPAHMPYDDMTFLATRVKPTQQRVELEMEINTTSANYARSKGEQIALNVDGNDMTSGAFYSSDKMDKQVLSSQPCTISTAPYVAGYFKDNELHMTPLKSIVQLRPSFSYLDKADNQMKGPGGGGDADDSQGEEEPEAKAVTVKFARRETEDAKARRMASYEYVNKKREEEPWLYLRYHQAGDDYADIERGRLLAQHTGEVSEFSEFHAKNDAYLQKLIPHIQEEEEEKPPLPSNVLSLAELKNMTPGDQIKALLTNAKVIRFSQLMSLLPKGSDTTSAIRSLQQVAMLVQGCWVVKSDILYPKDSCSAHTGAPAETLCRGRDYVMWRFTQSRFVVRKDIATVIKLPAEDVKDILEQMACLRVNKGWEFQEDFDSEFVGRHPEIIQRQQMLWDAKFQQLCKVLKISKADLDRKAKNEELGTNSPEKSKRRRTSSTRSRTKSGGMSDQSDTDADMPKGERTRRKSGQGRARKNSGGVERTRRPSAKDIPKLDLSPDRKPASVTQNGLAPQEASNGAIENDPEKEVQLKMEVLKFVREKFVLRLVLSLPDLMDLFHLHLAQCESGHILSTGVSEWMLEQSAIEVGAVQIPNQQQKMYAIPKIGDHLDYLRTLIVEHFSSNKLLRSNAIKKTIEEQGLEVPSDNDLKKIIRDYCESKGGSWYLKGTATS